MIKKIPQNLYITYSKQRVRDLKLENILNPFDKVITLDRLIMELFESKNHEIIIDENIASSIIYKIIKDKKIDYFSYLSDDSISLNTIYNFIIKCKRNNVSFETLHDGKKLTALLEIDKGYQEFKNNNNLVDIADIEQRVLENWDGYFKNNYDEIYVDLFEIENISFAKSKKQKQILDKLKKHKQLTKTNKTLSKPTIIKPSNKIFDNIDEVKTAIKIARKLVEEGIDGQDIIIVASDIREYAPLYKLFLDEYEMKGYSSIGTPLSLFKNSANPQVQQALNSYDLKIKSLNLMYKKLNLTLNDTIKENIKNSITILDEKIGIEITEPNQLVGLSKKYKHIIFIGTDINHFPPKTGDNFLYSYDDDIKYFCGNNYFKSSQTQYNELKRLGENIYIITASHSGKRELKPSIIIDNNFDEIIDISDIKSINELALNNQTQIPDADTKKFYKSITSEKFTVYDGAEVQGTKATHLSASQINKYRSCPLTYLYSNKIKIQAPKQSEEGFDVMEQGSLMHLCYEYFGYQMHIMAIENNSFENINYYDLMYGVSMGAYKEFIEKQKTEENIYHQIFLSNLQAGLKDDRNKGLLAKFVDYFIENSKEFEYFKNTEFEKEFALDNELKPYKLQNKDDKNYFIKGFIDRFDNLENHINIVDYKSKKVSRVDKQKQEDVETLKDIQLALYILYTKQQYPNKSMDAHLLSFKGNDKGIKFASLKDIDEDKVKQVIYETKENIEKGDFHFDNSDEKICEWCDIKFICHESVLSKKGESYDKRKI